MERERSLKRQDGRIGDGVGGGMNGGGTDSSEETGETVDSVHRVVSDLTSVSERRKFERFDQRRIDNDTHITARQQFKQALIDKRCLLSSCKQPFESIHMSKKLQVTVDDDNDDDEQQAIAASREKCFSFPK